VLDGVSVRAYGGPDTIRPLQTARGESGWI
jgi:hypothetical protein